MEKLITIFAGAGISFFITFLMSPIFLKVIRKFDLVKKIREKDSSGRDATVFRELHLKKEGTPTMGGILIWGSILITVLFSRILSYYGIIPESLLDRGEVYLPLFTMVCMGFLGAIDDYLNITESKHKGLHIKPKSFFIFLFSLIGALWFYFKLGYSEIHIPFYGDLDIGFLYIPLFIFIISASSNSVNITDGLDGLAGGLLIIAFVSFGVLAFAKGLFTLSIFCSVVVGALTAFLWNNVPPAQFYMGDTGSLALGATLGVIAMMIDSVFVLPIIGGVFVLETLSVIIQLTSKKLRNGKKIFKIAPFHHHLEAIGWKESMIVMRLWIIGGFFGISGIVIGFLSFGVLT